jgi:hypothetical protein
MALHPSCVTEQSLRCSSCTLIILCYTSFWDLITKDLHNSSVTQTSSLYFICCVCNGQGYSLAIAVIIKDLWKWRHEALCTFEVSTHTFLPIVRFTSQVFKINSRTSYTLSKDTSQCPLAWRITAKNCKKNCSKTFTSVSSPYPTPSENCSVVAIFICKYWKTLITAV